MVTPRSLTRRLRFFVVVTILVVFANGCSRDSSAPQSSTSRSSAVASSSRPGASPSNSSPPSPGPTSTAPRTIAADCSVDVSAALQAWLQSVPDGSTILLAKNACYRIESTVEFRDRHDLLVEGNNATLRAFTAGTGGRLAIRGRSHFAIVGSTNVTIRDLVVRGANPHAGSSRRRLPTGVRGATCVRRERRRPRRSRQRAGVRRLRRLRLHRRGRGLHQPPHHRDPVALCAQWPPRNLHHERRRRHHHAQRHFWRRTLALRSRAQPTIRPSAERADRFQHHRSGRQLLARKQRIRDQHR